MRNQRGEIATATVVVIAAGALLLGILIPKFKPFSIFEKSAANKKASWTKQIEKSKPVAIKSEDGKVVAVGTEIERVYDTGMENTVPKQTLGEKIGSFFARLTTAGIAFVVVSLLFFGGAPLVWIARKYLVMKQALRNTVAGIRALDDETFNKVKPALAASQDKQDKVVIDKLKTEITKKGS